MSNYTILDQYMNGQLTEKQEEAFEATLLKATFVYQEEQALTQNFAQWRDEEEQKKGKLRHLYGYGVAASFLLLVLSVGVYKVYVSKSEQIKTVSPITEKTVEPISTQKDTSVNLPIIENTPALRQKQTVVASTLPQKTNETPKNNVPQKTNENTIPPREIQIQAPYLADNDALFEETEIILAETQMDIASNTKMGVENMDSLRHIAQTDFRDKNYRKYIATINQLEKDKVLANDYLFLGEAYLHLNNNKAAIDNFKEAERLDADDDKDIRTLHLALAYIRDKQLDNARKTLKTIMDSRTSNFKETALRLLEILK